MYTIQTSPERKLKLCAIPTCEGKRYDLVHKFPMNNERAQCWIDAIDIPELRAMPLDLVRKRYFICSKHFRPNDYKNCESRSLNTTAYPRLHLKFGADEEIAEQSLAQVEIHNADELQVLEFIMPDDDGGGGSGIEVKETINDRVTMTPDVKNTESPAQYLVCSSNVPILLRRNQKKHQQQQQPEAIFGKSPHVPSTNQPVSDTAVVNSPVINIIDEKRIPNRYAAKRYTASPSETPPKKPCLPQIEPTANGWYFFSVNRMRVWIWYHVRCVLSNWMLDGHGGPDCEQRIALSPVECSASTYFGGQIMLSPNRFHRKNRSLFYYRTIQCKQWNFNKKNEYCLSVHVIFIIKIYTLFYQFRIAIEFEYVVDFFQFYHSLKFDYQQRIAIAKSQSTESPQKSPLLFLLSTQRHSVCKSHLNFTLQW